MKLPLHISMSTQSNPFPLNKGIHKGEEKKASVLKQDVIPVLICPTSASCHAVMVSPATAKLPDVLQFKWLDPDETGGRRILRYQAVILQSGGRAEVHSVLPTAQSRACHECQTSPHYVPSAMFSFR